MFKVIHKNYLPRFNVLGTVLVLPLKGSFCAFFGDPGSFALDGRKTLSASESTSASLPELMFSGPDVSGEIKRIC